MDPQRRPVSVKSHGSGTGPQTPRPYRAASCGHDALVSHQGHLLPRATSLPALAA